MSVDKFQKHQKSSKSRYVITDQNGNVVVKSNDEQEFLALRSKYLTEQKIEHKKRSKIK